MKIQWKQIILKSFRFSNYAAFILSLMKITEDKGEVSHLLGLMLDLKYSSQNQQSQTDCNTIFTSLVRIANLFSYIFYLVFMTFALKHLKMISFRSKHVVLSRIKRQKSCLFASVDVLRYSFFNVGAGYWLLTPRSSLINPGISRYSLYWGFGGPWARTGWVKNLSLGFDPLTVHTLASSSTDCAIPENFETVHKKEFVGTYDHLRHTVADRLVVNNSIKWDYMAF